MTKTEEKLASMLRENTGRHFLDSGGAYGRAWERNQGRDLVGEEPTKLHFAIRAYRGEASLEVDVTHRTFHWLKERLDWCEDYDKVVRTAARFIRMANYQRGDREWDYEGNGKWSERNGTLPNQFELAEQIPTFFAAWKARRDEADREDCRECDGYGYRHNDPCEVCNGRGWNRTATLRYSHVKGFIFDRDGYEPREVYSVNTYNEECLLDQTLQFVSFTVDRTEYVVLQVHGGCDVRGGYTDPVLFEVCGEENAMFDFKRAGIGCTSEGKREDRQVAMFPREVPKVDREDWHSWYTDDGCHWYPSNYEKDLTEYNFAKIDPDHFDKLLASLSDDKRADEPHSIEDEDGICYVREWQKGWLCVDEDGNGYCPHDGGKLSAGFY